MLAEFPFQRTTLSSKSRFIPNFCRMSLPIIKSYFSMVGTTYILWRTLAVGLSSGRVNSTMHCLLVVNDPAIVFHVHVSSFFCLKRFTKRSEIMEPLAPESSNILACLAILCLMLVVTSPNKIGTRGSCSSIFFLVTFLKL